MCCRPSEFFPLFRWVCRILWKDHIKKSLQKLFTGSWHACCTWRWHISSLLNHTFLKTPYGTWIWKYFCVLVKVFLVCEIMCWSILTNQITWITLSLNNLPATSPWDYLKQKKKRNFDPTLVFVHFSFTFSAANPCTVHFSPKMPDLYIQVNDHCCIQLKQKHYDVNPLWLA